MKINQNTKISVLIKENPAVIEAIASINKHFLKLRNPVLRKILASRVTIADAAKIGGTDVQTFFDKLVPLGFYCEEQTEKPENMKEVIPEFYQKLSKDTTIDLDVRSSLAQGVDPFKIIMDAIAKLPEGYTLKLINTFEPKPLISILRQKGYENYVVHEPPLVITYLKKSGKKSEFAETSEMKGPSSNEEIEKLLHSFENKIKKIDVRDLEMPLPMVTILKELETLPKDFLLYVHHKKVPQFLLPELQQRGYKWLIQEIDTDNIKLLIFKE